MNKNHLPSILVIMTTLTISACWMDDEPEPETQEPTQSTAKIDTCDETDFSPTGWFGPGVDENGKLTTPAGQYIFAATAGLPKNTEEDQLLFGMHSELVGADLMTREGLIAVNFGGSEICGIGRTMTLWKDRKSMMQFVLGDAHRDAILATTDALQEFKTAHWTHEISDGTPPTWAEYKTKLATVPLATYD